MLFEGALRPRLSPERERAATLAGIVLVAAALYVGLRTYADSLDWHGAGAEAWVSHVALNAVAVGVLLHVAIGRRWPFAAADA
jgi:hypothetical protein